MNDYISRDAVEQVLCGIANGLSVGETKALKTKCLKALYKIQGAKEILNAVDNDLSFIPAADVQPVKQWINANDRLPEECKKVIVIYKKDLFISFRYDYNFWYGIGRQKIDYWQPLPELPKDGDTE